jgi:two-component system cell cycle response regulator
MAALRTSVLVDLRRDASLFETPSTNSSPPGLERILNCPTLPSLPTVAMKVLELTSDRHVQLDAIAEVVQNDQALTSKILKTVNSSFYGLSAPCSSISRSLGLLGLSTVKSLVLSFSLVDMTRRKQVGLDLDAYWRRNVYSATASRKLALLTAICDPEEAFLTGIMQNVAMLAMDIVVGEPYREIVISAGCDHNKLLVAEHDLLGFDHAFVGAKLAQKWRMASDQVDAIANHHNMEAATTTSPPLTKIAIVANEISRVLLCDKDSCVLSAAEQLAEGIFGLAPDAVHNLVKETEKDAQALAKQLLRGIKEAPASEEILSRAEEARVEHQINMQRETELLRQTAVVLEKQATTDALTGVGNRALLNGELASNFERAKQSAGSLGFILMDADRFKSLNDTHGHQVGDEVLVELARRLKDVVGTKGIVCRYGGEEFAVLLPDASEHVVAETAERIRVVIARAPIPLDEATHHVASVPVTVSAGVAVMSSETSFVYTRAELLTQAADKALYAAKHAGRNCVRVFRPRVPTNAARTEVG